MKPELEKEIVDCAPYMFAYDGSDDLRKSLLSFGFGCGDGWFTIIRDLVRDISKVDRDCLVKVFEIKEKFGGLRFYISNGTDEIYDLIDAAERKSYRTCEDCGAAVVDIENVSEWIYTLCNNCKAKYGKEKTN